MTIAAIATPRGTGGIAVIRISGGAAFSVGEKIFRHKTKKYRSFFDIPASTAVFGDITDAGKTIDSGVAVKFAAPASYTGDDTVEISCHGGIYIANAVLGAAVNAGARLAEPGEFTKTAYLNGKISLTGAEAVGRLIAAVGEAGARVASAQSKGGLSKKIGAISDKIKDIISEVYVFIDYPGEDLSDMSPDDMLGKLLPIREELETLKASYGIGKIVADGLDCAIIGKPNAGKSTLLNMLSREEVAIVHDTPGTTRDIVWSKVVINGIVLNLYDTAGIRAPGGEIERAGIEKARAKIEECALIVGVFDAGEDYGEDDYSILEILHREQENGKKIIAILNKCDVSPIVLGANKTPFPSLTISAKNNTVLNSDISAYDAFAERLEAIYALGGCDLDSGEILTEERQYFEICAACGNVDSAVAALSCGFTQDTAGLDLELAVKNLDMCDSKTVSEDIVDRIFKNFCIGK